MKVMPPTIEKIPYQNLFDFSMDLPHNYDCYFPQNNPKMVLENLKGKIIPVKSRKRQSRNKIPRVSRYGKRTGCIIKIDESPVQNEEVDWVDGGKKPELLFETT